MKQRVFFLIFSIYLLFLPSSTFAQSQQSNEVQTKVGNPSPLAGGMGPGANIHYCQGDPQWANRCAMAYAACGPTSMAMVLSSFGDTISPPDMDAIFNQRGWRACGDYPSYMPTAITTYFAEKGYTVKLLAFGDPDINEMKKYLDANYLIIGSVSIHIFVVDGVNVTNNMVHLRDPARCGAAGLYWASNTAPWTGASGTAYPWYYAYAIKKTATPILLPGAVR